MLPGSFADFALSENEKLVFSSRIFREVCSYSSTSLWQRCHDNWKWHFANFICNLVKGLGHKMFKCIATN